MGRRGNIAKLNVKLQKTASVCNSEWLVQKYIIRINEENTGLSLAMGELLLLHLFDVHTIVFCTRKPSHAIASIYTLTQIWFMHLSCYLCYLKVCISTLNVGNTYVGHVETEIRSFAWKKKQKNKPRKCRLLFCPSYPWAGNSVRSFVLVLMFSPAQFILLTFQNIFFVSWIFCFE